ncbi:hypothetical protein [Bacillus cereus]|uniref:hypothetical protein n=1 Tax=Bacillus cereus TaxID=1396 RepID=UPI000BF7B993|nr:hypothetical protein [Bacillus cereus]PER91135.1 hypothetical protein CN500_29375 [Bacillus cereus]
MKSPYDYYITPDEYERAERNGISRKLLNVRVRRYAWDKDIAMTKSPRKTAEWSKVKKTALKNNICRSTFKSRRERGWSLVDSMTKPPMSQEEALKRANQCNRVLTDEQILQARMNGLKRSTVYDRLKKLKWDMEDAIVTPVLSASERGRRGKEVSYWN